MSTRSAIGVEETPGGPVLAVYCHFDGNVEGVGAALESRYRTIEQALGLVRGGAIDSLNEGKVNREVVSHLHDRTFVTFDSAEDFRLNAGLKFCADYAYLMQAQRRNKGKPAAVWSVCVRTPGLMSIEDWQSLDQCLEAKAVYRGPYDTRPMTLGITKDAVKRVWVVRGDSGAVLHEAPQRDAAFAWVVRQYRDKGLQFVS